MTRAEVIVALQKHARGEGPEIEWVCSTGALKCRWNSDHGPQYLGRGGAWADDALLGRYREVWTPREFLEIWQEVATFAEADLVGYRYLHGQWARIAFRSDGKVLDYSLDDDHTGHGRHWYWVARKAGV